MRILLIFLIFVQISILGYGQIIADHTVVDRYDDIPQYYIDQVKKMWLSYAGESHSQAIRDGFTALMGLNSIYGVNVRESGVPDGATSSNLRVSRATWGDYSNSTGWIYDYGEEDWFTNSTAISRTKAGISYCNNNNLSISAIGFGWCWDMSADNDVGGTIDPVYNVRWAGASKQGPQGDLRWGLDASDQTLTGNSVSLDTYLNATQQYIDYCTANGYTTKVFFTTGTVDTWSGTFGSENMYQAYLKNKRIRDYVTSDASRILFDYADILCYDDDGTPNTRTWDGHIFPAITTTNLGNTLVGHIGPAGALRLSKAMWWMLARIAGWDGGINNIPVEGVIVAGTQTISTDNGTTQLTATISPANATTQTVSWSISSGTTLATISATGLVTALNNGIVTARATAADGSGIYGDRTITITNQVIPVTAISLAGTPTITTDNGTTQLTATVAPANATIQTVTWSLSSGTTLATINPSGLVTAIDNGTVIARATSNDGSAIYGTLVITLSNQIVPVTGIAVTGEGGASSIITNYGTLQLTASVTPTTATNQTVTWSLVNVNGQATISETGLVTAISNGTIEARATANDGSGIYGKMSIMISSQNILVNEIIVTSIGFIDDITLNGGIPDNPNPRGSSSGANTINTDNGTLQLVASVLPTNATNQIVTWSLTNGTGSATISATGLVTALNNGIVTARATSNDGTNIFGELVITITNQLLPVSVSISASATDVTAGTLVTFTATPTNGGTAPVYQWKVNNTNAGTNSSTFSYTPMASGVVTCVLTSNALNTTGNPATSNQLAITVITSPIGNNTINYTSSVQGTVCATAVEGSNAVLAAPSGAVFTSVDFASYGNPSGTCPVFILGSCNALTSKSVVEGYLLGKNSATIPATNVIFGDPCDGTYKRLYISATYSSTQSGMIIGSTPTGGTGIYSYLWESSITSAVSGFSPASGTNNTKDYTPGSLTQTTWFRRTVTSGGLSNTSLAIFINVGSGLPVSVSISASATDVTAGTLVTFTATPTNGGTAPVYQWKVNNTNAGTNSSTFSYTPMASGVVTCVLTSNALNTTGNPATSNQLAITVITSPIGNNTINYTSSVQGTVCATAVEGSNAVLAAPSGAVFTSVDFASYGNPSGTCPVFILGSCNALTSKSVVEGYLLGKNSATIPATNVIFGDPCDGTYKRLYISATYSSTQSGMIIGSTPTGGTGIYSYLWESSITSAVSGFSPASGTNNTKDYTPGSLTQTTWFRRTVTSGGLSNTSLAIFINVGSGLPVSVSISASATDVTAGTLVTFTATPTNGGTAPVYQWKVNNTNAGTNSSTFSYTPMASGVVTCVLTSNALNTTGNPATSNQLAITVITSPIGNNTINYTSSVQGTVCATAVEGSNAVLAAPSGAVFTSVDFASYGNPSGTCPVFILGSCNAPTSLLVSEGYLLGKNSATIPATNIIFGDPCVGTLKRLYISATYEDPLAVIIIGSTPTGGNGIYSYLWESSTTSAVSGFLPASATNNTKDYTPGSLTQTTWFRRTITSGSTGNISNVIEINFSGTKMEPSQVKSADYSLSDIPLRITSATIDSSTNILYESNINIYPVPSNGNFTVEITSEQELNIDILVFNVNGTIVFQMKKVIVKDKSEIPFNLVSQPAGIYYLKFRNSKSQVIKKIMLSK